MCTGAGAGSGSTRFRRRFRRYPKVPEKVWEGGLRFSRVPQNIPEKVPGSRGAKPSQVQRVPGKVAEAKPGQVHLTHGNLAQVFPALGFPARFRKIYKNKMLRLLGIPPKLMVFPESACEGFFVKKQPLYYIFTSSHLLI